MLIEITTPACQNYNYVIFRTSEGPASPILFVIHLQCATPPRFSFQLQPFYQGTAALYTENSLQLTFFMIFKIF